MQLCQQLVRVYQQLGDLVGQSQGYHNMGSIYYYQGDWTQASDSIHKSLAIKQEIGDIFEQGILTNNLALIFTDRGDWEQAKSLFEQSWVRSYQDQTGSGSPGPGNRFTR